MNCVSRTGCCPVNSYEECSQDANANYNDPYFYRPKDGDRCFPTPTTGSSSSLPQTYQCSEGTCELRALLDCKGRAEGATCKNYRSTKKPLDPEADFWYGEASSCGYIDADGTKTTALQCMLAGVHNCIGKSEGDECSPAKVCMKNTVLGNRLDCTEVVLASCNEKVAGATCTYSTSDIGVVQSACDSSQKCLHPQHGACMSKSEGGACAYQAVYSSRRRNPSRPGIFVYSGGKCQMTQEEQITERSLRCEGGTRGKSVSGAVPAMKRSAASALFAAYCLGGLPMLIS
eukprot:TRINITY_DN7834_c0_g1_i1.p1 TRINITY_DN7834_c0_g1~~TRINITY_DN7834_c0_g1_i1.p1  ORF type:complete len:332 (+),score=13.96 TRINITY_DN7834_c0_g1_i1:134-997(+)